MKEEEKKDLDPDLIETIYEFLRNEPVFSGFDDFCDQLDREEKKFLAS